MIINKSTTLLSLVILTSASIKPSIAFATEINQSDIPISSQSPEQTKNKSTTVPSLTASYPKDTPDFTPQVNSIEKTEIPTTETLKTSDFENPENTKSQILTSDIPQVVASDDIASGTFGTAPWHIDSQGSLHIGAGTLDYTDTESPWAAYSNQINKVIFDGQVVAGARSNYLFKNLVNLTSFENIEKFDMSNVSGAQQMFEGCSSLIALDLSQTGAHFIANEYIFAGCTALEKLNIAGVEFDKSASNVFTGDTSLSQLTIDENFGFAKDDIQHLPTPSGVGYTGKWINVGGGTIENPQGESILTSRELVGMTQKKVADTYVWQQVIPAGTVTLHYVDQDGNTIPGQEDVTLTGYNEGVTIPFADYTPPIPGYTLDTVNQPDPTSKFTTKPQTFNIPYLRNQGTAINVRYVDENGTSISGYDTQITGFENEIKSTESYKIDIPGYTLDETKLPASEVTLTATAQPDIVFTYKQNPGSITLKYQDEQGKSISKDQTLEEDVTTPFNAENYKLDIPGYYLTSLPTNVTQFTSDPQAAIYKYAIDQTAIEAHDNFLYIGENWQPEDNFVSITSEDGTKTTVLPSSVVVDGQVDTSKVGDYTVTYTWTNPQTNKKVSKSIVVHVVDKSAILVHDSTLTVGDTWTAKDNFDSAFNKKGDQVPFDQIKVEGTVDTSKAGTYKVTYSYNETNTPQVMKYEVGASHQGNTTVTATITVMDKATVDSKEPTPPSSQLNQSNGSENTNNSSSRNTIVNRSNSGNDIKASNKALPNTGEKNSINLITYGLGIILALCGLILFRKRKTNK